MENEESKRRLGMEAVNVSFSVINECVLGVLPNQDDVHDNKLETKVEQDLQDDAGGESMIQKASSSDVENKKHFSPDTNAKSPDGSQSYEQPLCLTSNSERHKVSHCLRTKQDSSDQNGTNTCKAQGNVQTISVNVASVRKVSENTQNKSDEVLNVPEVSEISQNIPEVAVITLGGDSKTGGFHEAQAKSASLESQEKSLKMLSTEQSDKDNQSTLEIHPNPAHICDEINTSDCRAGDCVLRNCPEEQSESASVEKPKSSFTNTNTNKRVINVYITWTDNESRENSSQKWTHEDCSICRLKFYNWKQHVKENHSISMDSTGGEEGEVGSVTSRNWKEMNTEIPDVKSLVNVSVPCLVNLESITQKAQSISNERGIVDENGADLSLEMKRPAKRPYQKTENTDISKLGIKLSANLERSKSHKRRKQSHARKVEPAGETSLKKRKLSHLSETEPAGATSLKRSHSTKVDVSDNFEELDDPDFVLPVNTFSSQRLRRKKPMTYTNVKPSHACSIEGCGMMFPSLVKCNKHEKEDHQGLKYECRVKNCQDKFATKNGRAQHERIHKDVFECNHCELTFSSLRDRGFHMRVHASFACGFKDCQKIYTTERELLRHRKTHTGDRTIKCQRCPKAFFTQRQLTCHQRTHTAKIHPCDICGKLFKQKEQLKVHKRQHTEKVVLVCQYCGKNLRGRPSLEHHERLHTGERPFQCKYCDMRFVCISTLQTHEQDHTGYQFVCAQCGDKFKTKQNLQEHERIHTGEKPEKCEHCSELFRTRSDLWIHKKLRHSKTKDYKCNVCSKAFALRIYLNRHQTVHTGERNYECKYCHKKYSSSSIRSDHIKYVHLGIKRTGHQGKARRLKEEDRKLAKHENQVEDSGGNVQPKLETKSSSDQIGSLTRPIGGTKSTGVHSEMIPLNLAQNRRHCSSGEGSHPPARDPSRSDFDTMVESIIQFSKEH